MTGFWSAIGAVFEYGEEATLMAADGERVFRAFIEPEDAGKPERPGYNAQGRSDARRYGMLAEGGGLDGSETGSVVSAGGGEFVILRLERMPGGYWAGVLKRKAGGADA